MSAPPPSPRQRLQGVILGVLAVVIGVVFVLVDPAQTITAEALGRAAQGTVVAATALFAAAGAGRGVLGRWAPRLVRGEGGWAWALGLGIGLHTLVMGGLFAAGAVSATTSALGIGLLAAGWLVPVRGAIDAPRPTPPWPGALGLLVGGLLLAPALVDALAPPTDTDEIYYQLAAPRYLLDHGGLGGGVLHADHSRPLPVQLVHAATLALGGETAPRLWHLGVAIALLLAVRAFAAGRWGSGHGDLPALALATSYSFLREAGLAYNDLPCALWLLLAAVAALEGTGDHERERSTRSGGSTLLVGVFAGLAIAAKFTAGPAGAALLLIAALADVQTPTRAAVPRLLASWVAAGVLAALPTVPWALRNVAADLHPLFPFAGWPTAGSFVFVYPEKYGDGHTWVDALLLPLRLLFTAEPDSFVFYGRLSLLWLPLGLAALWGVRRDPAARRLVPVLLLAFVAWASSAQLLRYLLPVAGIAALAGGLLPPRRVWLVLLAASLPANLAPALEHAAARAAVVTGQEPVDTFLERVLPAWPALRYLRDEVPPTDTVALLNCWPSYWVQQPYVLGSVEDNVPIRYWLWAHGDRALQDLREAGVRWLLVGDIAYLKKSYAFLPPAVYADQFVKPQKDLEQLLLRDGSRVFREHHHSVWRLDAPAAPP